MNQEQAMSGNRLTIRALFMGILAALYVRQVGAEPVNRSDRPTRLNVLFLAVDDLRPELGCYGASHIVSPRIDRLAARGVRFDRAYCQYAICGPSRASLLTGLRPDTLNIEHIDTYFRDTVPDVVTLPQHFRAHGYTTVYAGKVFHAGQTDEARSWSRPAVRIAPRPGGLAGEYQLPDSRAIVQRRREEALARFGPGTDLVGLACGPAVEAADAPDDAYADGRITASALATLREIKDQPFFLAVGWHKPHLPFVAPKRYFDLYDPQRLPLCPLQVPPQGAPAIAGHRSFELRTRAGVPTGGPLDEATSRWLLHGYAACISFIDAQVGRILDELDALGLTDRTVVVLWGDHGWHLGEYGIWGKATNYEVATRVPLIVAAPGAVGNGQGTRALAEFVDVYPTLCELAGLPRPAHLEGVSLVPVLKNPAATVKAAARSQFPAPALREWAARPLSPAMRQTFFGPLMEDTEATLAHEHGDRWDPAVFAQHLMGYSLRTDRYRLTLWVDRRHPKSEPYAVELYDHESDSHETVNVANRPEHSAALAALRQELEQMLEISP